MSRELRGGNPSDKVGRSVAPDGLALPDARTLSARSATGRPGLGGRTWRRGWPWLVLVVALAPRLWGIGWQLPAALYFDELKYVEWAGARAAGRSPETDYRNPSLYRHLLHAEYRAAAFVRGRDDARATAVFQLGLARVTSAVLGAVACLLTALAAAELATTLRNTSGGGRVEPSAAPIGSPALVGAAAGLLLGWSLLHVHLSHYAVNDAVASCFLAGGLLYGLRAFTSPSRWAFLAAGLCAGLAASAKYNYGAVVALPLAAALVGALSRTDRRVGAPSPCPLPGGEGEPSPPGRGQGEGARPIGSGEGDVAGRLISITLAALGMLVGVVAGMPELVTAPAEVLAGAAEQARIGESRWNGQSDLPTWLLYLETLDRGIGVPVLVLALLGVVALARWRPVALAALLAAPLLYLMVMLRSELFFARFAIPLLPFLAVLAGVGIGWLARLPLGPLMRGALVAGALGTALAPQVAAVLRHDALATTSDTRVLADEWLVAHAGGTVAATEVYGLPLAWAGRSPRPYRLQRVGSFAEPATVRRLACDGARYLLVASLTSERALARRGDGTSGYAELARAGTLVATFDPFRPNHAAPAHPDDTGIPFWHLGAYARPGPRIEVYELADGGRGLCEGGGR